MLQRVADVLFNIWCFCFHKEEYRFSLAHFHMYLAQVNPAILLSEIVTVVNTEGTFLKVHYYYYYHY